MCTESLDERDQILKAWVDIVVGKIMILRFPMMSGSGSFNSPVIEG